jgi:hypothetical protein
VWMEMSSPSVAFGSHGVQDNGSTSWSHAVMAQRMKTAVSLAIHCHRSMNQSLGWMGQKRALTSLHSTTLLAVLTPNRIIHMRMDVNCSNFHLRVFLGLSNPQGQRQTSTMFIPCDNFGERKAKFNLETSRTTQMQLYKCVHIP